MRTLILWAACLLVAPAQVLTHGTMVGAVDHQSAIVWARVPTTSDVRVVFNNAPVLSGARLSAVVRADTSTDFNVKLVLTGLNPAETVWYLIRVSQPGAPSNFVDSGWGRFRTAPHPTTGSPVRLVVGGDVRSPSTHSHGLWPAMGAVQPDFFLSLGDFPYADIGGAAVTVPEYRAKHLDARSDPRCQLFHRDVPIFPIWDDHEVLNNWDATTPAARVAAGIQAFHEMLPTPPGRSDIWRSFRWGADLEVFLTDCRRYRAANSDPDLPGKTMLGTSQEAWLIQALRNSTATFKLVAVSVPINYNGGRDSWPGFRQAKAALLNAITDAGVANVVFVSADTHRTSFHHLHEGFREYMLSPVANGTGSAFARQDLGRRYDYDDISNFGVLTVDPTTSPKTLRIEVRNEFAVLGSETIFATVPVAATVTSDLPEARGHLFGPRYQRVGGTRSTLPRLESGPHRLDWLPSPSEPALPAPIAFTLPNDRDASITIATDWRDERSPGTRVLYENNFDGRTHNLITTDVGTGEGPSAWFTDEGYLWQSSNINSAQSGNHLPGTLATTGPQTWSAVTVRARARSVDNDAFGIVFRYRDPDNHYLFVWDSERNRRWLIRRFQGNSTLLASDTVPYTTWRWYDLEIRAIGSNLTVAIDGETILQAADSAITTGGAGFMTWANDMVAFDDFVVREGDASFNAPQPLIFDNFTTNTLARATITDATTEGGPSTWSISGGELRQDSNIGTAGGTPSERGTVLRYGNNWTDVRLDAQIFSNDDDTFGVTLRDDGTRSWRFLMNAQSSYRRLVRIQNNVATTLFQSTEGYQPGRWYEIAMEARGSVVSVWLDGVLFASIDDPQGPNSGGAGFVTQFSAGARFDQLRIREAPPLRPTLAALRTNGQHQILGAAPFTTQPGPIPPRAYRLALSFSPTPGLPLASLGLQDPRILPLTIDPLFLLSLDPLAAPFLNDFEGTLNQDGTFAATLIWPPSLPSGLRIHLSGWIHPPGLPTLPQDLLPALELTFP